MCGFYIVWVCVGMYGFCNVWVCERGSVLVICVLLYTVFCIVCTVFVYCFVYIYFILIFLSVLVYGLLSPSENSIALIIIIIIIINH